MAATLKGTNARVLKAAMRLYRSAEIQYGPYAGDVHFYASESAVREWERACKLLQKLSGPIREGSDGD